MNNEWTTPKDLYDQLNAFYGFNLDPCCTKETALCENFFTEKENGLDQNWKGHSVFMNPPYDRSIYKWVEKAHNETMNKDPIRGVNYTGTIVVALLPAKTDTKWFHEFIYGKVPITFIKGRLKFGGSNTDAPFPSMIVVFKG